MIHTETSVVVRQLRRLRTRVRSAVQDSRVLADGSRFRAAVTRSVGPSTGSSRVVAEVDRVLTTTGRWVRGSWLYGWLTAEPEPEVVVIDLRETYTVGPVIAALDRVVEWAAPRWRGSGPQLALERAGRVLAGAPVRVVGFVTLGLVGANVAVTLAGGATPDGVTLILLGLALLATRERRSAATLRGTWVGRALAALLVPPEPPGDRESTEDGEAIQASAPDVDRDRARTIEEGEMDGNP